MLERGREGVREREGECVTAVIVANKVKNHECISAIFEFRIIF